ncbi:MAG: hypothetical protein LBB90_05775 [Tannerella sp.]|jgi:hypothetical protein|nr:hypothetical protein [Tannerella sp.]
MGGFIPTTEFAESYPAGDKRTGNRQFFFSTYPGHPNKFPAGSPEWVNMSLGGLLTYRVILRAVQFCALPVSIEKGIRPHAFFPVG